MKKNEIITFKDGSMIFRPLNKIILIEPSGKVKVVEAGMVKTLVKSKR